MTETGWPLIPREVLPAPVRPAQRRRRRRRRAVRPGRQLSLFGAEAADPSLADLAGLLAGPGEVGRMGGTARVSVVVDAAWRVHVLVAELVARGWRSRGLSGATVKSQRSRSADARQRRADPTSAATSRDAQPSSTAGPRPRPPAAGPHRAAGRGRADAWRSRCGRRTPAG